jgi:hypothetical protein
MLGLPNRFATMIVAVAVTSSCVDSTKVGFSNGRANDIRVERMGRTQDVIANGNESCEVPESTRRDPTPIRLNACPGEESSAHRVAARD